jgi:hypothetical protein
LIEAQACRTVSSAALIDVWQGLIYIVIVVLVGGWRSSGDVEAIGGQHRAREVSGSCHIFGTLYFG